MPTDRQLVGLAGEHHVCSLLAQHGWAASLTRDGLKRTDLLAVRNDESRRMVEVQVKTISANSNPSWPMGANGTAHALSEREWYVLVLLAGDATDRPRSFVVPRDHVAAATWIVHQAWLTDPNAPTGKRNVGVKQARVGIKFWLHYEDRWDLFEHDAGRAPVMFPAWMRKSARSRRVGLPAGHPWRQELPEWA